MSDDIEAMVEERLAVFEDEPDLNDWVEVMCGAAMAVLGIFHLIEPGELVNPDVMRWFAAAVAADRRGPAQHWRVERGDHRLAHDDRARGEKAEEHWA